MRFKPTQLSRLLSLLLLLCIQTTTFATNSPSLEDIQATLIKASRLQYSDLDSMSWYTHRALKAAKTQKADSLIAESYRLLSLEKYNRADLSTAMTYLDSAEAHYRSIDHELGLVDVLFDRAIIVRQQGDLDAAISFAHQCKDIYQKHGQRKMVGKISGFIGHAYSFLKSYDKALKQYQTALEIFQNDLKEDASDVAGFHLAIATMFKNLNQPDSALFYFDLADRGFQLDSNHHGIAMVLNNKGALHEKIKQPDSAIFYYKAAVTLKNKIGVSRGVAITNRNLSELLRQRGDYSDALRHLDESYQLVSQSTDSFTIRDYWLEYAGLYLQLGKHKESAAYFDQFVKLDQHLSSVERNTAVSEVEAKYESEKQERRIAELELGNQQATNRFNMILFVSILLLLVVTFVIIYAISKQKAGKMLSKQNDQISKALHDKEVLMKEVHHRVKNNLQTVSSLLKLQSSKGSQAVKSAIHAGQSRVTAMAIIHQMLYQDDNLISIHLDQYIDKLVFSILDSFRLSEEDVNLNIDVNPLQVEVDSAISIGLIVNELITNSLKYAFDAESYPELSVALCQKEESLELTIKDNGSGFPPEFKIEEQQSFGLNLVNMIASKLEATIAIYNQAGATIQMSIRNYTLVA